MTETFELYKDAIFMGRRDKDEIEKLGQQNKPLGYELIIFDDLEIAILEKEPQKIERIKQEIHRFKKITDRFKNFRGIPEAEKENIRTIIMKLITGRL